MAASGQQIAEPAAPVSAAGAAASAGPMQARKPKNKVPSRGESYRKQNKNSSFNKDPEEILQALRKRQQFVANRQAGMNQAPTGSGTANASSFLQQGENLPLPSLGPAPGRLAPQSPEEDEVLPPIGPAPQTPAPRPSRGRGRR